MLIDDLTLATAGGPMRAYAASPDGGAGRGVIVIQRRPAEPPSGGGGRRGSRALACFDLHLA